MRIVSILSTDAFDVRLGGNETSKEGHLEMKVRGQWVTVSAERWTALATSVVCRQLGYHGTNISYLALGTVDENAPVLGWFHCLGDEVALADCTNVGFSSIRRLNTMEVLYISCQIGKKSKL